MNIFIQSLIYLYLAVLWLGSIIGVFFFKKVSNSLKLIIFLLVLTCVTETVQRLLKVQHINGAFLYHLYSVFEGSILAIFLMRLVLARKSHRLELMVVAGWIVVGISNVIYLQPLAVFNSNVLLLESISLTILSATAIYQLTIKEDNHTPSFIVAATLLAYWSSGFFFWGYYELIYNKHWRYVDAVRVVQVSINILTYAFLGFAVLADGRKSHNPRGMSLSL